MFYYFYMIKVMKIVLQPLGSNWLFSKNWYLTKLWSDQKLHNYYQIYHPHMSGSLLGSSIGCR